VEDREVVALQLGREPRAFRGIAARCPWGLPAVTVQEPVDVEGRPFPTTYYLTCRYLVAAVSRLEAAGGVGRWSQAAARDPVLRDSLERATQLQRRIRHELAGDAAVPADVLDLGIAGSRTLGSLKCLHAHVAFALAQPGYLLGELILDDVEPRWPPGRCCSA
jgi:uncharacterized protein